MRYGWNLSTEPWERAFKEIQNLEWKKVPLDSIQSIVVPEKSGVYLICGRPPAPSGTDHTKPLAVFYNVLYAGQSGSLRSRFVTHAKFTSPDLERAKRTFQNLDFWYAPVESVDLNRIEGLLLDVLGPTANRVNAPLQGRLGKPEAPNKERKMERGKS
jgi:hypothetical protein